MYPQNVFLADKIFPIVHNTRLYALAADFLNMHHYEICVSLSHLLVIWVYSRGVQIFETVANIANIEVNNVIIDSTSN